MRGSSSNCLFAYYLDQGQIREFLGKVGLVGIGTGPVTGWKAALEGLGLLAREDSSNAAAVGLSLFFVLGSVVQIVGIVFSKPLADRFGKKAVFKMKSAGTPIALHFGSRYPFGYGRSYTQFDFADLALDATELDAGSGEIRVRFTVRNSGSRAGVAVPQLYVRDLLASMVRPVKELKAFGRVELRPGESARVGFAVPTDMLSFTGAEGRRIVEPGEFELQVGASSSDIRLRAVVELTGARRPLGREWRMQSRCEVERWSRAGRSASSGRPTRARSWTCSSCAAASDSDSSSSAPWQRALQAQ